MAEHPPPVPKRLHMTPRAGQALQALLEQLGTPMLDARITRWRCGCALWYFHISFGHLAETTRLERCAIHPAQASFFPPVPDRYPANPPQRSTKGR